MFVSYFAKLSAFSALNAAACIFSIENGNAPIVSALCGGTAVLMAFGAFYEAATEVATRTKPTAPAMSVKVSCENTPTPAA